MVLYENWYIIIALLCCGAVIGVNAYKFYKLPVKEKLIVFKEALCALVKQAEVELGSGKGQEKLSYVYNEMARQFKFIPLFMSAETFGMLVNGALYEVGIWTKS